MEGNSSDKELLMISIELGSGTKFKRGRIHVDLNPDFQKEAERRGFKFVLCDVKRLSFEDNYADHIAASHILEHFDIHEVAGVLKEWYRVLKVGGTMKIVVPNMEAVMKSYLKGEPISDAPVYDPCFARVGIWTWFNYIWGTHENEFNYHKCGFDKQVFAHLFSTLGINKYVFSTARSKKYEMKDAHLIVVATKE